MLLWREKGASTATKRTALDARLLVDVLLCIGEDRTLVHLHVVNHRYKTDVYWNSLTTLSSLWAVCIALSLVDCMYFLVSLLTVGFPPASAPFVACPFCYNS